MRKLLSSTRLGIERGRMKVGHKLIYSKRLPNAASTLLRGAQTDSKDGKPIPRKEYNVG